MSGFSCPMQKPALYLFCYCMSMQYWLCKATLKNIFRSTYVTGSAKIDLIAHDRKFNFCHKRKDTSIHYQVSLPKMKKLWVVCFWWLCFSPALAIRTSGLGPSWSSGGKVEDWLWLKSFVVLNKDFCCLLAIILASYGPCVPISRSILLVHLPLTFFHKPLARHAAPASLPLLSLPDTTIWEPTSLKKLSKLVGTLVLYIYRDHGAYWFLAWKYHPKSSLIFSL